MEKPACDLANNEASVVTMRATAPEGISEHQLGRPLNIHFQSLFGEVGKSIFGEAEPRKVDIKSVQFESTVIDTQRGFDIEVGVNAGVWGGGVSFGQKSGQRHAVYRAYQMDHALEIDDTLPANILNPEAFYYIARIFYGHSYEVRIKGSERQFHAGVKARYYVFEGGVSGFASTNKLSVEARGKGLEPTSEGAVFVRNEQEFRKNYKLTGDPVPIYVEYRSIPHACIPKSETVPWVEPVVVDMIVPKIHVCDTDAGGAGGQVEWTVELDCKLGQEPIALKNPTVLDAMAFDDGQTNDQLQWRARLFALPGDVLSCTTRGDTYGVKMGNHRQVPLVSFEQTIGEIGSNQPMAVTKRGAGNGACYEMDFKVEFPQNVDLSTVGGDLI